MEQIRLDIIPKGLMPVCHSSQYDKGRVIRLNLVDGLQGYTLSDETVTLNVRKPDNNIVTAGVNVVSGATYVDIVTTEQMTACEGENLCEIVITKGDVKIASLNFKMKVEVDPLKDGIESETEIHNLETQIAEIDARIVPPIVAEEVSNQYDSENVIFDDTPTENHGTGYTVTSEGIKNYVDNKPNALVDLTDVDIDNPTSNQALVWDTTEQKWINGEVSTVGGLNDLNDVTIDDTSLADKQELVYNGTAEVFENKTTRVELTQAEYYALANPLPDVDYYITDAPSMQGTSADLSYDGGTDSVYDVVEEVKSDVAGQAVSASFTSQSSVSNRNVAIGNAPKANLIIVNIIFEVTTTNQPSLSHKVTVTPEVTIKSANFVAMDETDIQYSNGGYIDANGFLHWNAGLRQGVWVVNGYIIYE